MAAHIRAVKPGRCATACGGEMTVPRSAIRPVKSQVPRGVFVCARGLIQTGVSLTRPLRRFSGHARERSPLIFDPRCTLFTVRVMVVHDLSHVRDRANDTRPAVILGRLVPTGLPVNTGQEQGRQLWRSHNARRPPSAGPGTADMTACACKGPLVKGASLRGEVECPLERLGGIGHGAFHFTYSGRQPPKPT